MPGQGIFIGEPLANPFGGYTISVSNGELMIRTQALIPGRYAVAGADSGVGPYHLVETGLTIGLGMQEITLKNPKNLFYRVLPVLYGNSTGLITGAAGK